MYKRNLVFAAACIGMLLFGISLITLGSVAAPLREKFNLDAIASGTLFSILPVGILAGSLIFGPFSDRYGYKIILMLSSLLIAAGFQGIAWSSSLGVLKICIFLFGVGGGFLLTPDAVVDDGEEHVVQELVQLLCRRLAVIPRDRHIQVARQQDRPLDFPPRARYKPPRPGRFAAGRL